MRAADTGRSLGRRLQCVDRRFHLAANELQRVAVAVAFLFDLFEQSLYAKQPNRDLRHGFGGIRAHQQIMTIVHVFVICWLTEF
jgi:hypothetical protein